MRRPSWRYLVAISVAAVAWACSSSDITAVENTLASIKVTLSPTAVQIGQNAQASATLIDQNGGTFVVQGDSVKWLSQDVTIAKVSSAGVVTGVNVGSTNITAVLAGKTGSAQILVNQVPVQPPAAVKTVAVSLSVQAIIIGQTGLATADIRDASNNVISGKTPVWSSSAPSVATVSATGVITAVTVGSAVITAVVDGISGTASIIVNPPPATPVASISVTIPQSTFAVTQFAQAVAIVKDAANNVLTGRQIVWSTSNFDVATVSANGFVTALASGTSVITATSEGKSASLTVTVNNNPVASVRLTLTPNILIGTPAQAAVSLLDAGALTTIAPITFSSSNTAVATVNSSGLVTGLTNGTSVITATANGISATATVTVSTPLGSASQIVVTTQPSGAVSGLALTSQPVVSIQDAGNQVIPVNIPVSATIASGTGTLTGTTTVTSVNGVATFTNLQVSGQAGNITLRFSANVLTPGVSGTLPLTQNVASLTVSRQPNGGFSGVPLSQQPIVQIKDNAGLTISGSTLPITAAITSGTGALVGTTTVNAVSGVATFGNVRIDGGGTFALTFSTPAPALAIASSTFLVQSGFPSQLQITSQPSTASASGDILASQPVIEVRDVNNNLVTGAAIVVTAAIASGSGAVVGTVTATAVNGIVNFGGLGISGGGAQTLSFSIATPAISTVSDPILVTQVAALSRDGGSTNGGSIIRLTGGGFGTGDVVKFGTTTATATVVDANNIDVTVPAHSAGAVNVSVTHGAVTSSLASGWTYYPAPTTLLVNTDFESGPTIPGLLVEVANRPLGDSAFISTEKSYSGTHSVKQVASRDFTNGSTILGSAPSTDIVGGPGRYHRWYMYFPAATLAKTLVAGQIKLFLSRASSPTLGFDMLGVGVEFAGANRLTSAIDQNVQFFSAGPVITADVWHEIQVWEYRDPVAHLGYTKVWWDGKLVGQTSSSDLGDDNPLTVRDYELGLIYTQRTNAWPLIIFVDDVKVGNGYIDP